MALQNWSQVLLQLLSRLERITRKGPALSDAQHCLDGAKLAHEKLDGSMDKLQATLAEVLKDLKALTFKKKKVTALINKYQEKLSKSQENVTITEGEISTIEAYNVMSNDEVERLAKLEGMQNIDADADFDADADADFDPDVDTNVDPDLDADADTDIDRDLNANANFELIFLKAISVFLNFGCLEEKR
ncbi:hypothetical protein MTR67_011995 [Solanum verrucosum]|uniref:Uncharacterized protein n=1 Tax=Solanum verrucosum TaxID=315347 RepID=A0AAF0TMI8_SOLVR|nr:hypothetical protein MTR67_011995 [Solanum verrucosum]